MLCGYCKKNKPINGMHYSSVGVTPCRKLNRMFKDEDEQISYTLEKQPPVTFDQLNPGNNFRWNDKRMMVLEPVKNIRGIVLADAVDLDTGETTVIADRAVVKIQDD